MKLFIMGMKKWNFKSFFSINLVVLLFVLVLLSLPPTEGEVIKEVINNGDNEPLIKVSPLLVGGASDFNVIEQTYLSLSNETNKISGIDINSTQIQLYHHDQGIFVGGDYEQQSTLSTFGVEVNYLNPRLWEMSFEGFELGISPPSMYNYDNFFDLEILKISLEGEDRNITIDGQSIKLFVAGSRSSNEFRIFLPMNSIAPFGDQSDIEHWYYTLKLYSKLSDFTGMTKISQIEDFTLQVSDEVVSAIEKYPQFERIGRLDYPLLNYQFNARYIRVLDNFMNQILELIPFFIGFEFLLLIIVNRSYSQLQERYLLLLKRGATKRELMKDLIRASIIGPALLLILIICTALFLDISIYKVAFIVRFIIPWLGFHILTSLYLIIKNFRIFDTTISAITPSDIKNFDVKKLLTIIALIFAIITLYQLIFNPLSYGQPIRYYYRLPHFVPPLVVSCLSILIYIKMKYLTKLAYFYGVQEC